MGRRQLSLNLYVVVAVALAAVAVVESQGECDRGLPGVGNFERNHMYKGLTNSDFYLSQLIAKTFTLYARGAYPRKDDTGEWLKVNPVFQGRITEGTDITYSQLSGGGSIQYCYTPFLRTYICEASPQPGTFDPNSMCPPSPQGQFCTAIFKKDSGILKARVCQGSSGDVSKEIFTEFIGEEVSGQQY